MKAGRILLTGSESELGRGLLGALRPVHDVRILAASAHPDQQLAEVGDLRDRDLATRLTAGCETIIHLPGSSWTATAPETAIDIAARGTYNLITTAPTLRRLILISSLRLFDRYPADFLVNEDWAPRPTTDLETLAFHLAELTAREVGRTLPIQVICLRLGELEAAPGRSGEVELPLADAVQAVERALVFEPTDNQSSTGWWVFHVRDAGDQMRVPEPKSNGLKDGYTLRHPTSRARRASQAAPAQPARRLDDRPSGDPRSVVIFGAGGPLGAVTATSLSHDHILRLADVRAIADIAARNVPQWPGAPVPRPLEPPHEQRVVDVTDPEQVMAACAGMDAILNCSVVRQDPVESFRVNIIGAYNIARAAVACGIRRIVYTGPSLLGYSDSVGYRIDFAISPDVPARPGSSLYTITKFLGQEICRVFADEHDLVIPALYFGGFINPENTPEEREAWSGSGFIVSWADAGLALRQALRVPSLPRPFEVFHITADLPHGQFPNEKAKRLLHWQPKDTLEAFWRQTN